MKFYNIILIIMLLLVTTGVNAQSTITGKIFDNQTKEALVGATIAIPGTQTGTTTNTDGSFSLYSVHAVDSVVVRFMGYQELRLKVEPGKKITAGLNATSVNMQEIVISASRNNVTKRNIPQQVSVISAESIISTGANDLSDVLKKTTGVDVLQFSSMLSGVGIRGFRPQYSGLNQRTLLLVDGRPAGVTNLAMMDLSNVDRIEVVKGAASALYGSQAMGGVVNVITKKTIGEIKKTLFAGYGSYNTLQAGVNAGGSLSAKTDFDVSFKYFKQKDNIIFGGDNFFRNKFKWTTVTDTYRNKNFIIDSVKTLDDKRSDGVVRPYSFSQFTTGSIRFGERFGENWRVDVGSDFYSAYNVGSSGNIADGLTDLKTKSPYRYSTYLNANGLIKKHRLSFKTYSSKEVTALSPATSGFNTSRTTTTFSGFQLQDNLQVKNNNISFGVDRNKSTSTPESWNATTAASKAPYSPSYGIYSTAFFANTNSRFFKDKLIVTLAGRYDNIDFDVRATPLLESFTAAKKSFGVLSPSFGLKYKAPHNIDIHSSIGSAFVTPDAYNVAGYSVSGPGAPIEIKGRVNIFSGNPDLKPERATTFDIGFNYLKRDIGLDIDITYFSSKVTDRITKSATTAVSLTPAQLTDEGDTIVSRTTYINADKSDMQGLEFGASYDIGAYNNYDYSLRFYFYATKYFKLEEVIRDKTITTSDVFRKKNITNVADLTMTYGIEYALKGYNTRLSGRYVGKRFDQDNDIVALPEIEYAKFMVLDCSITIPLSKKDRLILQINNITDENYYESRGFNAAGRNFNVKYSINL